MTEAAEAEYPADWEADVVLSDGGAARLRPIRPTDADRLVEFYARVGDESKYLRFFAPYPELTDKDVERFTHVDHDDRAALIVTTGEDMIAVGRYDRTAAGSTEAEVAFLVEDAHQGRGLGSILLEHLAQAARDRGVGRFVAEVLPRNRAMVRVFKDAGYSVRNQYADGVVHVEFPLRPTETSIAVSAAREHRAEARSVQRVLTPRSVAVVGASRSRDNAGRVIVRNLVLGGFTGPVYVVHPDAPAVAGVPAYSRVADLPGAVDLAVLAVPAGAVADVVVDCARKGVHALLVVAAGYADSGDAAGLARQEALVRLARANGMRVVGPNSLGLLNSDAAVSLNATLAEVAPTRGTIGLFAQSGAMAGTVLAQMRTRGLGISTFVSAGNRADVSGNDLLQFWEEDPATEVVLLHLESMGNPRKFGRIARRVARIKPVVAVRARRATRSALPPTAVDELFAQTGVIRLDTVAEMLDVAELLAYQPLPRGPRVAVVGNSDAVGLLAAEALAAAGLDVVDPPFDLGAEASGATYDTALRATLARDDVDAVLAVLAPAPGGPAPDEVAAAIAQATAAADDVPVVCTFLGSAGAPTALRRLADGAVHRGSVPSFASPEEAARALGHVARYAQWRREPAGPVPDLTGCAPGAARTLVAQLLAEHPDGVRLESRTDLPVLTELLAAYGLTLMPTTAVSTVDEAVAAAEGYGWNVVLKASEPSLRHRPDLAHVQRNLRVDQELREAWAALATLVGDPATAGMVVQPMAPAGVPVVVQAVEDRALGPVVSFGISGLAVDLLGDRSYRLPPLTEGDAAAMVRSVRAAPLLFGHRGAAPADVAALEELLHRVGRLADELPDLALLELDPVLVAPTGLAVVAATAELRPSTGRREWFVRRLG